MLNTSSLIVPTMAIFLFADPWQVTMAIGAASMAKRQAIVTHLTALQEIAARILVPSPKSGKNT